MAMLEIRPTGDKGRGLFACEAIAEGGLVIAMQGITLKTEELTDDLLAMQVGPDLWFCGDGNQPDDCVNHSCAPNTGFLTGDTDLYAVADIAAGEEITWDYSTSMSWPDWTLECRCRSANCRQIVKGWNELSEADRDRLRPMALKYLRND